MSVDVGSFTVVTETRPPRAYRVQTGRRYLQALEDGEIVYWPEQHLFLLDDETGTIIVDGGLFTFSACWPDYCRGKDVSLNAFLLRISFASFMRKAAKEPFELPDIPQTLRRMKREIITDRREDQLGKSEAREIFDLLQAELSESMTEHEFAAALYADDVLSERFGDGGPSYVYKHHEGMLRFWEEIWLEFRARVLLPAVEAERSLAIAAAA